MNQLSPREYLKEIGIVIDEENESFDCDLEWSVVIDIMFDYAKKVNDSKKLKKES